MKLFLKTVLTCGFFVLLSSAICAQSGPASVDIALQMRTGRAYKTGSPYCATKEYPQIPPDGTKVRHTVRICRDSLGRGRIGDGEIYDPVEGVGYTLDTVHRRAGRTVIRPSSPEWSSLPRIWGLFARVPAPGESLGTDVIEGLVVEGVRSPNGLELLAKGETERWFSRELEEVIVMKKSDGFYGSVVVYRLTHIDRSEHDPSLFRVPANYTISDTPNFGDASSFVDSRLVRRGGFNDSSQH